MGQDEIARVIYLGLLVAVVVGSLVLGNRRNLGKVAQQAAIWGLIFVGVAAGFGLWSDIRGPDPRIAVVREGGQVEVPRAPDGHYYLTLQINGVPVEFMVDTGASELVLSQADAQQVGVDMAGLRYVGQAFTANGVVRTARVQLQDVALAGIDQGKVGASVNEGQMAGSLLGMDFLNRFSRMEFVDNRLVLTP